MHSATMRVGGEPSIQKGRQRDRVRCNLLLRIWEKKGRDPIKKEKYKTKMPRGEEVDVAHRV